MGAGASQGPQLFEFQVNALREFKRVKGLTQCFKRLELSAIITFGRDEPIERRLRDFVGAVGFGSDVDLGFEFGRRLEQVLEPKQLMFIEIIEQGFGVGGLPAMPAEEGADVGKVFLFDVGVIVFLVGSAPGEGNGWARVAAEGQEVIIEEFIPVI